MDIPYEFLINSSSLHEDSFSPLWIPRSYSRTPEDSDTFPFGGGGSGGRNSNRIQNNNLQLSADQTFMDESPFIPTREHPSEYNINASSRRFIVGPEPQDTVPGQLEFSYGRNLFPPREYAVIQTSQSSVTVDPSAGYYYSPNQFQQMPLQQTPGYNDESSRLANRQYRSNSESRGDARENPQTMSSSMRYALSPHSQAQSPISNLPPSMASFNPPVDLEEYLRKFLHLPEGSPVSLEAIPDPPNGGRPSQSLPNLCRLAIFGSPNKQLTLQQIYAALESHFTYYRNRHNDKSWKNSIRHQLSLALVFKKIPRPITEPGKGHYWRIDLSRGEGFKRERKRRKTRKGANVTEKEPSPEEDDEITSVDSPVTTDDENSHIDPSLLQSSQGSKSTSKRTNRRASPYQPGPSNTAGPSNSRQESSGSSATRPGFFGRSNTTPPTLTLPRPRFGQSSLLSDQTLVRQSSGSGINTPAISQSLPDYHSAFGQPLFSSSSYDLSAHSSDFMQIDSFNTQDLSGQFNSGLRYGDIPGISRARIQGPQYNQPPPDSKGKERAP